MQNKPIKTIFVCEFITGGGFNGNDLPQAMVAQGKLMLEALLRDLSVLPYQVYTVCDHRIAIEPHNSIVRMIDDQDDCWRIWEEEVGRADAVWLIAPESSDYLEKMTALAGRHHTVLLGSDVDAVRVCGSKSATCRQLEVYGIATIATDRLAGFKPTQTQQWLVKPDVGAGCEDTYVFDDEQHLYEWVRKQNQLDAHVVQPYLTGDHASVSCVMHDGGVVVLSCNQQLISLKGSVLQYEGCILNGYQDCWEMFEKVASEVALAFPGLRGYVGIDLIIDQKHQIVKVVEVNPRLTVSYGGIAAASGVNPAAMVIDLLTNADLEMPVMKRNIIPVMVTGV